MDKITVRGWFERAQRDGFALGSFNVANLETFKAVVAAAVAEQSPTLIESSDGETAYVGPDNLVDLVQNARQATGLPIFLNLDHSRDPQNVRTAIKAGYDLVHYDGSKESIEKNIENLIELSQITKTKNIILEGEMDYIIEGSEVRSVSAQTGLDQSQLTEPNAAKNFVADTNIDTFAVSIGNVHGLYTTPKRLNLELLSEIRQKLTCFLSLHGGSGISDDQIRQAIKIGRIVKINVSTELRQAFRLGLESGLSDQPAEMAMYKITPEAITDVQKVVQEKMRLFGSSGQVRRKRV